MIAAAPAVPPAVPAGAPQQRRAGAPSAAAAAAGAAAPPPNSSVDRCVAKGVGTLSASGTRFVPQRYFQGLSCPTLHDTGGVCASCADRCHRGHRLDEGRWEEACFCDCGLLPSCRCRDPSFDPDALE